MRAKKKAPAKKHAAARKPAAKATERAKTARKSATAPSRKAPTYEPPPITGIGWPPFRYPPI